MATLNDMATIGAATWAQVVAEESQTTGLHSERKALAKSVAMGKWDARVATYCAAFWGDNDTTPQATVTTHAAGVLEIFSKLGVS